MRRDREPEGGSRQRSRARGKATWKEFERLEPAFAARVRDLFTSHKHHTMATLRRDGSPRISGTEVGFADDELLLGVMGGALRAGDLRRDARVALHTHTVDPPPEGEDPSSWCGSTRSYILG